MCNPFIRSTPQNYTHKKGLHHVNKHKPLNYHVNKHKPLNYPKLFAS